METTITIAIKYKLEILANPNRLAMGVNGKMVVSPTVNRVANNKCVRGLLLNNDFLVLITRTTKDAEMTDSINQEVLK